MEKIRIEKKYEHMIYEVMDIRAMKYEDGSY